MARDRITQANLEAVVARINRQTNSPMQPWGKNEAGETKANIGNYHLGYAYGGVKLYRMTNEGGGVRDVLSTGYTTKRELYNAMFAFIAGLETGEG
jgi:hypothetical protein